MYLTLTPSYITLASESTTMQTQTVGLVDAISPEKLSQVGGKIAALPDGDEFKRTVEHDLWQEFVGADGSEDLPESVEWNELSDESKSIFGYVDDEEEEVPWWLESFEWKVESRGETIENLYDNLSDLSYFDQTATEIHKPELADGNITNVLDSFRGLGDTIDEKVGTEVERNGYSPPSDVFEISDGTVRTTDAFRDWYENLLELCPPFNETLTSLVMVNSNVSVESVEGKVPNELLDTLEDIGVIDESGERVYDSGYHEPIANTGDAILKNMDGLFDCPFSSEVDSLELLFYRTWAENYDGDKEDVQEWIEMASGTPTELDIGESKFGLMSFNIPIMLTFYSMEGSGDDSHPRIIYTSRSVIRDGSYGNAVREINIREIDSIMRSADFLQE